MSHFFLLPSRFALFLAFNILMSGCVGLFEFILLRVHSGKFVKTQTTPRVSDSVGLMWSLRICISNNSQVVLMLLVQDYTLRTIAI